MKFKDKIVVVVCSICMAVMCCFGISYKSKHITYADTVSTTKQTIGMYLATILTSVGARLYIATAEGYSWLVDNFDAVMETLSIAYTASQLVEDAQLNYDDQYSKITLGIESGKALSGYLWSLYQEGLRQGETDIEIGEYEQSTNGTYVSGVYHENIFLGNIFTNQESYFYLNTDSDVRLAFIEWYNTGNTMYRDVVAVSQNSFSFNFNRGTLETNTTPSSKYYNGKWWYVASSSVASYSNTILPFNVLSGTHSNRYDADYMAMAVGLTFGEQATTGGVEEIQVYGDGTLGLDDMINTADRDKEIEIDYGDLLGEEVGTKTLAQIVELIQQAILEGNMELVDAIPVAEVMIKTPLIDPSTIDIPLLFDGLPEITKPDCVGLGPCLLSGVQSVSQHLQSIYNSNSSLANYTVISLAVGIALYILTGGI